MHRPRLPPLSALRAFEAAARLASFKAAAEELLVTPTAISHQIKQLEAYMSLRVLDRTPRAVTLTPRGKALYEATAAGFGEIERVVTRLLAETAPTTVTLTSTIAFLSHWLVPRMDALRQTIPNIDLRLHASNKVEELRSGGHRDRDPLRAWSIRWHSQYATLQRRDDAGLQPEPRSIATWRSAARHIDPHRRAKPPGAETRLESLV